MSVILDSRGRPIPQAAVQFRQPGLYPISQDTPFRGYRPRLNRDFSDLVSCWRHTEILSDARWLYASGGGIVAGAVHRKADYVVGQAWMPQYLGKSPKWKTRAEELVYSWCVNSNVRGQPFTFWGDMWRLSRALDVDGDAFVVLTQNELGFPAYQVLEAHRIGVRDSNENVVREGRFKGRRILSGVIVDDVMRPIGYRVLAPVVNGVPQGPDVDLPAPAVVHVFDPKWFSQSRGIPSIAFGALDFFDVSEIRSAEKVAVKANSRLAIIESNETGKRDISGDLLTGRGAGKGEGGVQMQTLDEGTIRYIKSGTGKIEAHSHDRPGATWEGFMDHVLRGAFLGMDFPAELAWDASQLTGPGVRAVIAQAQRSVTSRQQVLEMPALSILLYAIGKHIDSGNLSFVSDWWNWTFTKPSKLSVDIGRDAQNAREDYSLGVKTMGQIQEEMGRDVEEHFRERAQEWLSKQRISNEMGVPIEAFGESARSPSININQRTEE